MPTLKSKQYNDDNNNLEKNSFNNSNKETGSEE